MDVVCHAGALSAPWGRRDDFEATNVIGTVTVAEGCVRHAVRRLVYVSSPSVTFNGKDQVGLTEEAPLPARFTSVYSETKARAERYVRSLTPHIETVIIRPKALFGPGDTSLVPRLLTAARARRLPQIGNGRNLVDLTYIDNAVDGLLLALTAPAAAGQTYVLTNGESVELWAMVRALLRGLGLPPRLPRIPVPVAMAVAALMEGRSYVTGCEPRLTRYTVAVLARTQTYNIAAARRDLGYRPSISVEEGLERTLAALRSAPENR
jgi:nucleoside-diphosphate-sugar epimerase